MLDEREGAGRRRTSSAAPSTASRSGSARRSSPPGPIANLLLAVAAVRRRRTGSASTSRRRVLGPPVAGSVAERAGMRAGDWVRAWSHDGGEWHDIRSLTDLRWQVTQAMLHGEDVDCSSATRDGRGQRRAARSTLRRSRRATSTPRLMQRIGLGNAVERAGAGRGQGRRRRRARPGCKPGDRDRSRSTASRSTMRRRSRERIRAQRQDRRGGADAVARSSAAATRLELVVTPAVVARRRQPHRPHRGRTSGQPPRDGAGALRADRGLTSAVTQTWQMSVLTVKMLGKMIIGQASLQEPERAGDDRRLRRPVGAPRPGLLPRLSRASSASASAC